MVNKSPKCSTWMQSQKQQNDLCSFPMHHSISQLSKSVPQPVTLKKLKLNSSMKTYVEKAMATHSSVLVWRIPGMGEPGGLPSIGCTE